MADAPKYDVAISFLMEDITLATALNDKLREGLDVFFFPRNQEQLAGTDGLESMREPFVSQSRLNVVLYREKWGKTPWTGVEAAAIKDSCLMNGFRNLFFFAVQPVKILPVWLPNTHIRFNYGEFSLEDAVGAIKARVIEQGGKYKPLTPRRKAEIFKTNQDFEYDKNQMRSHDGLRAVWANVKKLFSQIEEECEAVSSEGNLTFRYGSSDFNERNNEQFYVLTVHRVGLQVHWFQPHYNSLENPVLAIEEFSDGLRIPGESLAGVHIRPPQRIKRTNFSPDLSRTREHGWKEDGKEFFIANHVFAERCVSEFIDLIERDEAGKIRRKRLY